MEATPSSFNHAGSMRPKKSLWGTKTYKSCVLFLGLFLITGCETYYTLEEKYSGHHDYIVSAPVLGIDSETLTPPQKPLKVKRLDIKAPVKDDKLFSVSAAVNQRNRGKTIPVRGTYLIDSDLEPPIRQALTQIFVTDPNAVRIAEVEAQVVATNNLKQIPFCKVWVSRISLRIWVTITENGTQESKKEFYESLTKETCTSLYYVPREDYVSEALQEAYVKVMQKIANENYD